VLLATLLFLLLLAQFTSGQSPDKTLFLPIIIGGNSAVTLPETTEVLGPATLQHLTSISADSRVFTFDTTTAELADVDVGDVIVGGISSAAPDGFLRRVTRLDAGAAAVTLETEPATLEEAIQDGTLDLDITLTPSMINRSVLAPGVSLINTPRDADRTDLFEYQLDEFVIFDMDGSDATRTDRLTADGYLALTQEIDLNIDIRLFKLRHLEFVVTSDSNTELSVTASGAVDVTLKEKALATHYFTPILVQAGPLPLVFRPELKLIIGADGIVRQVATFGVQQVTHMEGGLRIDDGNVSPVSVVDVDLKPLPVQSTTEFIVRGYVGPQLALKLYGVLGPYSSAELFGEIVSEHATAPAYRLYAGLEVPVGIRLDILSNVHADASLTAIQIRRLIAEVGFGTNRPPNVPTSPTPANGAAGQPSALRLAWSGGDPDGDPVQYDVRLEANDSTPDTLVCNSTFDAYCDVGSLLDNTTYYWQVIAEDDENAITTGPVWQFTTSGAGGNRPPTKPANPSPGNGAGAVMANTSLSWTGGDPDGDAVTYDVLLDRGTGTPSTLICNDVPAPICYPTGLLWDSDYRWQVIARDPQGLTTAGDVWRFGTRPKPDGPASMDIALILDSSGSMGSNDPRRLRIAAANVFADTMLNEDMAAVIGFDTRSYVPFPLDTLGGNRNQVRTAINGIGQSGGSTNIVAGLNDGYRQLDRGGNAPKAAVLLTDGQHNEGSWLTSSYSQYAGRGWPVFTIGLGSGADETRLRAVAAATGGQYYKLNDPSQLVQVYFTIQAAVTGSTVTTNSSFTLQQGQTESLPTSITANQNAVNFVTTWPGSEVNTTLIDPTGRVITPDTPLTDPLVFHSKGATYEVYRVDYPVAGQWTVQTYGADLAPGGELVTVQVSQRDDVLPSGNWKEVGADSATGGGISQTAADSVWPAIVTASDNSVYVAWSETVGKQAEIYVKRWNGTSWSAVGTGSASGGGVSNTPTLSELPSMDIGPDGSLYLAWQEADGGAKDIYVKRWNGTSWEAIGQSTGSGGISQTSRDSEWPDLRVAPDGTIYVAWREDEAADNEIYVRRWQGASWSGVGGSDQTGGISNNSGDSGRPSLVVTAQGQPYVGWTDASTGDTEVYVRRLAGSIWAEVGMGSATGGGITDNAGASRGPSLAANSQGHVFVAYPDNTNGPFDVMVLRWDGGAWSYLGGNAGGVSQTPGDAFTPDMAVSGGDVPFVTWFDNSPGKPEIYVRRWNGAVWEEAGTGAATGGGVSSSQGSSAHAAITVSGNNTPFIVWNDNSSGNHEIYIKQWLPQAMNAR
jgi:hypothetical protein